MHRAFASVLWSLSLLMCNNALATGEGCAPLVAQGLDSEARQLYIKSANSPHWKKLAFDSTDNVAGQRVNFLYVVERPDESDLKPGAIAIKVQRYTTGEKSSGKVSLFRNAISTKPICAAQVTKEQFDAYHGPEMSSNRILRSQFHAGYNGNKTDEPDSKRASFLFPAKLGQTSELTENLKADILYYKALNPDSSCIPFHLNLSSRVRHLTLGIVELDPPADSEDPYQANVWDVKLSD